MHDRRGIHSLWATAPATLWVGMICAISFMEAWLKFRAPGISLSSGLQIGKLVFGALNKMEWFAAGVVCLILYFSGAIWKQRSFLVLLVVVLLSLQTFWLLPELDKRADQIIAGSSVNSSDMHVIYVVCEVAKVVLLMTFSLMSIKRASRILLAISE